MSITCLPFAFDFQSSSAAANAILKRQGVDVNGKKWKKAKVAVTAGGK